MRCAVLGDPIAHSLSPVLHRAGYAAVGLDWEYDAHRVPGGALPRFLAGLGAEWRGLSLTMPLKREAAGLVDTLSDGARLAGAVNTVVLVDGARHGDNTDVPGAVAALRERVGTPMATGVILGGGATAASTGQALCDLGCRDLTLMVRDPARAARTVEALSAHPTGPAVRVLPLDAAPPRTDVLVSTVPAAAQTDDLVPRLAAAPVVFDVVYDPWPTPLAASALVDGRVVVSGLDLLVHQAALQFRIFTGVPVPLAVLRAAGEQAIADRALEEDR